MKIALHKAGSRYFVGGMKLPVSITRSGLYARGVSFINMLQSFLGNTLHLLDNLAACCARLELQQLQLLVLVGNNLSEQLPSAIWRHMLSLIQSDYLPIA